MKPNELRIGNLVYNYKGEVEEFNADFYHWIDGDKKPIPLTEEWLLKFGFSKQDKYHSHRKEFKKGKFSLMFIEWIDEDEADFALFKTPNGELSYYAHGKVPKVKHVHQLQNLYFALTGEELTIKE